MGAILARGDAPKKNRPAGGEAGRFSLVAEEGLEPPVNAGEVELLDVPKLQEQILTLVVRGTKIDHQPGDHDDWANAAAGALRLVTREDDAPQIRAV